MAESEFILLRRFTLYGDAEAFAQIVKRHAPLVYGVCLRILGNKDNAADAVQDTFLQLVHDAAKITGSLPNWLHRVATCRAIDLVRNDSQRKKREFNYAACPESINSEYEKAAWRDISVCIDEELENLDERTREVLILRFFEGLSTNDIAEKCGISQPAVYRWMESGIELLRLKLKSRGIIVPAAMFTALLSENIVKAAPASILKELGKIAIAGNKTTIGIRIASSISEVIAVKTKIMAGMLIVLLGAGLTVVFSFIANGENRNASTWEIVRNSLRNGASSDPDANKAVPSDINQLLSKFSQAREKTKSFIIDSNEESKFMYDDKQKSLNFSGTMYFKDCIKYDGNKLKTTEYVWGNISPIEPDVPESEADYSSHLCDGEKRYSHGRVGSDLGYVMISKQENKDYDIKLASCEQAMGYMHYDFKRIDELIRENPSQVKLRDKPENIRGVDCFVIDAILKGYGEYHLWIDPEHDYHIVKMQIKRVENDRILDNKLKKGEFCKETFEVFTFERYGDIWFPKKCKLTYDKFQFGNPSKDERSITFTKAVFNPDHEALGSFKLDDIPNGANVLIPGVDGISYTWKNGKIIDSDGQEVDPYNMKPVSLIGKSLPDLERCLIEIDPKFIQNKMLLVCFFDMDNAQSIDFIKTLNKRWNALLDKNVYIIFIHAGSKPAAENTLNPWAKRNNIQPPVGASMKGLPVLGYTWGVKSLPWLILTDKNHIVTDEGFSITELDEKIKEKLR